MAAPVDFSQSVGAVLVLLFTASLVFLVVQVWDRALNAIFREWFGIETARVSGAIVYALLLTAVTVVIVMWFDIDLTKFFSFGPQST